MMDFLTTMILEKMAEGGPEIIARMFAASLCIDLWLISWCILLAVTKSNK